MGAQKNKKRHRSRKGVDTKKRCKGIERTGTEVIEEVVVIEVTEHDDVEHSQDLVRDMEDEPQTFSGDDGGKLDSAYCSGSGDSLEGKDSSPRSAASEQDNVDKLDEENIENDLLQTSLGDIARCSDSPCSSSTQESSLQSLKIDRDNGRSNSSLKSAGGNDNDENGCEFNDDNPYFAYGNSWNLPHITGKIRPYSAGGYFSDDENITTNTIQGDTVDSGPNMAIQFSVQNEISPGSRNILENIDDDSDAWENVAADNDNEDAFSDLFSDDDDQSVYGDVSASDEEEDSSTESDCGGEMGTTEAQLYRKDMGIRGNRSVSEKLFEQNIKNGQQRYSRALAKKIENTFTDENIKIQNQGRRVVCNTLELFSFFLGYLNFHSQFCPSIASLKLDSVSRQGMKELYGWSCRACAFSFKICSDYAVNSTPLHDAVVLGALTAGIGYNVAREFLSSMAVTCLSDKIFRSTRASVSPKVKRVSTKSMKAAAARERQLAIKAGNVIKGILFITVIVDGAWSKRSYKGGMYNALSGVGVIVGYRTRKVLYCGTMNKYCKFCEVAANVNAPPGPHDCARNYSRQAASSAMEPKILLEGFTRSVQDYGLIYKFMFGDGDSSVYSSIMDYNPYGKYEVEVTKIECVNHLFRRFCNLLKDISKQALAVPLPRGKVGPFRDAVHDSGRPIRTLITESIDYWDEKDIAMQAKVVNVSADIPKMIRHYFGNHSNCSECIKDCTPADSSAQDSIWSIIVKVNWEKDIDAAAARLQNNAKSLLLRSTNNAAEGFHSIGNKSLGGRRVNHTATDDYMLRQYCTVVQYNFHHALSELHEEAGTVPTAVRKMEQQKINQSIRTAQSRTNNRRIRHRGGGGCGPFYGPNADQYMSQAEFDAKRSEILEGLKANQRNRELIERDTRLQRDSERWISLRRKMITASNFSAICRMKPTTGCKNMVKKILYQGNIKNKHTQFGQDNEATALQELERVIQKKIEPCGLFIDEKYAYLGATPDGLVGEDGIVEVKCLSSARHLTPEEAIKESKAHKTLFTKNGKLSKSHQYYYQVQGQLYITQRSYCFFAIWTPHGIKYVQVDRDDEFWQKEMEQKLTRFYMECVLRELVDRKIYSGKPIEEPPYILEAKQQEKEKGKDVQKTTKRTVAEVDDTGEGTPTRELPRKRRKQIPKQTDREDSHTNVATPCDDESNVEKGENSVTEEAENLNLNSSATGLPTRNETTHHRVVTEEEFDGSIEMSVAAISQALALETVDNVRSELSSEAVDYFLDILRTSEEIVTKNIAVYFTTYFAYPECTIPSRTNHDIYILGGGTLRHWRCLYYKNDQLYLYDSKKGLPLSDEEQAFIQRRYPHHADTLLRPTVTQQPDQVSCGVYAIAFAVSLAQGVPPESIKYSTNVKNMRGCLSFIIRNRRIIQFPYSIN